MYRTPFEQHVFEELKNLRATVSDKFSVRSAASAAPPKLLTVCQSRSIWADPINPPEFRLLNFNESEFAGLTLS
jgi:hypothetical protein